jgi:hypothetical protein
VGPSALAALPAPLWPPDQLGDKVADGVGDTVSVRRGDTFSAMCVTESVIEGPKDDEDEEGVEIGEASVSQGNEGERQFRRSPQADAPLTPSRPPSSLVLIASPAAVGGASPSSPSTPLLSRAPSRARDDAAASGMADGAVPSGRVPPEEALGTALTRADPLSRQSPLVARFNAASPLAAPEHLGAPSPSPEAHWPPPPSTIHAHVPNTPLEVLGTAPKLAAPTAVRPTHMVPQPPLPAEHADALERLGVPGRPESRNASDRYPDRYSDRLPDRIGSSSSCTGSTPEASPIKPRRGSALVEEAREGGTKMGEPAEAKYVVEADWFQPLSASAAVEGPRDGFVKAVEGPRDGFVKAEASAKDEEAGGAGGGGIEPQAPPPPPPPPPPSTAGTVAIQSKLPSQMTLRSRCDEPLSLRLFWSAPKTAPKSQGGASSSSSTVEGHHVVLSTLEHQQPSPSTTLQAVQALHVVLPPRGAVVVLVQAVQAEKQFEKSSAREIREIPLIDLPKKGAGSASAKMGAGALERVGGAGLDKGEGESPPPSSREIPFGHVAIIEGVGGGSGGGGGGVGGGGGGGGFTDTALASKVKLMWLRPQLVQAALRLEPSELTFAEVIVGAEGEPPCQTFEIINLAEGEMNFMLILRRDDAESAEHRARRDERTVAAGAAVGGEIASITKGSERRDVMRERESLRSEALRGEGGSSTLAAVKATAEGLSHTVEAVHTQKVRTQQPVLLHPRNGFIAPGAKCTIEARCVAPLPGWQRYTVVVRNLSPTAGMVQDHAMSIRVRGVHPNYLDFPDLRDGGAPGAVLGAVPPAEGLARKGPEAEPVLAFGLCHIYQTPPPRGPTLAVHTSVHTTLSAAALLAPAPAAPAPAALVPAAPASSNTAVVGALAVMGAVVGGAKRAALGPFKRPLRVTNLQAREHLLSATSNLAKQAAVFVDEECTQPATGQLALGAHETATLWVSLSPTLGPDVLSGAVCRQLLGTLRVALHNADGALIEEKIVKFSVR